MHSFVRRPARLLLARSFLARALFGALALFSAGCLQAQTAATQTASAPAAVSTGGYLQMVAGLAVVLGLVGAAAWLLKRLSALPGTSASMIRVIGAAAVGQRERVVLVEIGETWLLVGVAPGQVRRLHTMPKSESAAPGSVNAPADQGFSIWLRRMMDKRNHD